MEELDFQGLLERFSSQGFERGEQVILGHFGTVQTLLSLVFGEPVKVRMVDQQCRDGEILRTVHLVCGAGAVCHATTRVPLARNRPDILRDIVSGRLGLGQIVAVHQVPSRRDLADIGRSPSAFWRSYTIEGPQLRLEIFECFPRQPFEEAGWLQRENEVVSL